MKKSIQKIAAFLMLSVLLVSCSDDPDASPNVPLEVPPSITLLQGEWELVSSDATTDFHSLKIMDNVAAQRRTDGSILRASFFTVERDNNGNKIIYGNNIIDEDLSPKAPNFFKNPKIVTMTENDLVLESDFVYTFRKMDPVK